MSEVNGQWGQSLWDLALQESGSAEAAYDWLMANEHLLDSFADEVLAGVAYRGPSGGFRPEVADALDPCFGVNSSVWPEMEDFAEEEFRYSHFL